jgi:hypothetical protein
MHDTISRHRAAFSVLWLALLAWPTAASAQTVTGQALAAKTTVTTLLGSTTTTLADTGRLSDDTDARWAAKLTGQASVLSGETLHAATIGWADQVASEAGLTNLALDVAGITIAADLVLARSRAVLGSAGAGYTEIDRLRVGGVSVPVTGGPNQTVSVPGGVLIINEQRMSSGSTIVNALHLIVSGIADVVIGSAIAGIQ